MITVAMTIGLARAAAQTPEPPTAPGAVHGMPTESEMRSAKWVPPITKIASPDQSDAVLLYPGLKVSGPAEQWDNFAGGRAVRNITQPSLTPVLPDPAKATGAAVIIAPGGAFLYLGMDTEGFNIAHRLADRGIAAFVLKYRTSPTPRDDKQFVINLYKLISSIAKGESIHKRPVVSTPDTALADAEAALRLVRSHAAEWHVDPARVGFLGFSAGAFLGVTVSFVKEPAARPDFLASLYGPTKVPTVPPYAPPLFTAAAMDDPIIRSEDGGLLPAWSHAHRPVEAHFYEHGGHGFVVVKGVTADMWFDEFYNWMKDRGELEPKAGAK
jgi:acetyl esterase/lipase